SNAANPRPASPARRSIRNGQAQHDRRRTVIQVRLRAVTPVDVIALRGLIHRPVALVAIAEAVAARAFAAAIVVRNDVVLRIDRVAAGADPRDRRWFGARRARTCRAAAAAAQEAVERTVAPVIAAERIAFLLRLWRARWVARRFGRV